jgi:phosphoserine phosphatase
MPPAPPADAPALPMAAFAYDFDGTLAPGNMQDHAFIPGELGMDRAAFWAEVSQLAREQRGDEILAYMNLMLIKARQKGVSLAQEDWTRRGANLPFFPGVETWFARQNARAADLGLKLNHFIISSGNRELIEGSAIADVFQRIYASAFMFDAQRNAAGIALAVNYTSKTQFLFRINKNTLDEWDAAAINAAMAHEDRPTPFDRIVFFGDGATDVPTMRLVTDQGGYSVSVYDAGDPRSVGAARNLRRDGRARFAAPADYREGGDLDQLTAAILEEIAARVRTKALTRWPDEG